MLELRGLSSCVQTTYAWVRARAAETRRLLPVCTDSCTNTAEDRSCAWPQLIALLEVGLVIPSTLTETHGTQHVHEHSESGRTFKTGERTSTENFW
jgi:hypothetical protein